MILRPRVAENGRWVTESALGDLDREDGRHVENLSCDRIGGTAAHGGLCDRAGRILHAGAEKHDRRGTEQQYHSSGVATVLDRPLGSAALSLVLARPVGPRSLLVTVFAK